MNKDDGRQRTMISAGRMVCTASKIDGPGCVIMEGDRIVEVRSLSEGSAPPGLHSVDGDRVLSFPDGVLLPGLIDLHAHPANSGSVFGVSPDDALLARGTTTALSQGDAGADNIHPFVEATIRASRMRVFLAINLSRTGEAASWGCFENLDDASIEECVSAAARHTDHVRAISVNVSHHACGQTNPREILRRGLCAGAETGLPLLFGMRRPEDWPLEEQLAMLRPGDIVTYCFRNRPHCIVQDGKLLPCVREARQRGILFDVGHGTASFCFDVAQTAIDEGFQPDTISTDLQNGHQGTSPQHDLPLVMSKLRAAGMPETDIFAAVTATPADILESGATDNEGSRLGRLSPGSPADLVVLTSLPTRGFAPDPLRADARKRRSAGSDNMRAGHAEVTLSDSKKGFAPDPLRADARKHGSAGSDNMRAGHAEVRLPDSHQRLRDTVGQFRIGRQWIPQMVVASGQVISVTHAET